MEKNKSRLLIQKMILQLESHANAFWYGPLLLFLAWIDMFIIFLPMDGIFISSVMLQPKKWWGFALVIAIGSALGGILFALIVQKLGLPWLTSFMPSVVESSIWVWVQSFFQGWGLILLFILAASPIAQQPGIAAAVFADHKLEVIFSVLLFGRLLKYFILGYISSHAPHLLKKLWGVSDELKESGFNLPK